MRRSLTSLESRIYNEFNRKNVNTEKMTFAGFPKMQTGVARFQGLRAVCVKKGRENMRGKNMVDVKRSNRRAILQLLHEERGISRKQIATQLNLTSAAITMIVTEMIDEGIVCVGGAIPGTGNVGRKEMMLELSSEYCGAGIMLSTREAIVSAVDFFGRLRMEQRFPMPAECADPAELLRDLTKKLEQSLKDAGIPPQRVLGVGVALQGLVNSNEGLSESSFGLWKGSVPVRSIVRSCVPYAVFVDNNVRSLACAQNYLDGSQALENALFLRSAYGIGGAILTNYHTYPGSHDRAGELGHIRVPGHNRLCRCGSLGCLETFASVRGMLTSAQEIYGDESTPLLYDLTKGERDAVTIQTVLQAAEQGDARLVRILEDAVEALAYVIASCVKMVDVNKVILYGQVFENSYYNALLSRALRAETSDSALCDYVEVSRHNGMLDPVAAPIQAVRDYMQRGGMAADK